MNAKFTQAAEQSINGAMLLAKEFGHPYIGTEHILLSMLQNTSTCAYSILSKCNITAEKVKKTILDVTPVEKNAELTEKNMTPRLRKILEDAFKSETKFGGCFIGTEHILLSMLEDKSCVGTKIIQFLSNKNEISIMKETLSRVIQRGEGVFSKISEDDTDKTCPKLSKYGTNLVLLAQQRKLEPVIGRDAETDRVLRILCRKSKNNPCLIGEAGVGKTAIVEGLAQRISEGNVPSNMLDKKIFAINISGVLAGAKYRGDFEERINGLISEAVSHPNVILFIDEIHTLIGAGSAEGAVDAANIFKPELARGNLHLIGATTIQEYQKSIEKDPALHRRFQTVTIEEPSEEATYEIVKGVRYRYEIFHHVTITDAALQTCIAYTKQYLPDRFFPDKALDVLDDACAKKCVSSKEKMSFMNDIIEQNKDAVLLLSKTNEDNLSVSPLVLPEDIASIVQELTGIPLSQRTIYSDVDSMKSKIKESIIGQDRAVDAVCHALIRSRCGLGKKNHPIGLFLFLGESGVGKTALAQAVATVLFSVSSSLFRMDMSEFSESSSISKLIGSPPGYVGYEEGGCLTEYIRRHPYSVILFDEIEKAHPDILNLLLQIADEGVLTDSFGRKCNFKNACLIMTSNICPQNQNAHPITGFSPHTPFLSSKELMAFLRPYFRTEWINRMDEIILFDSFSEDDYRKIIQIKLQDLQSRCQSIGIHMEYAPEVIQYLLNIVQHEKMGVRPVERQIITDVETPISTLICSQEIETGENVFVDVFNGNIRVKRAEPIWSVTNS